MIEFQLRRTGGAIFPRLRVETLRDGLEGALFVASELNPGEDWWLALLDREQQGADFPTLHIQVSGGLAFLQYFASASTSPDGKEGWMTLVGPACDPDVPAYLVTFDAAPDPARYFEAGFAEGIAFSRGFLCPKDDLVSALRYMHERPDDVGAWRDAGTWISLGLV